MAKCHTTLSKQFTEDKKTSLLTIIIQLLHLCSKKQVFTCNLKPLGNT